MRSANMNLRSTDMELRSANMNLRSTDMNMRSANMNFVAVLCPEDFKKNF